MKKYGTLMFLHILLMIYSLSGVFSKLASKEIFLSFKFIMYYGLIVFILFLYAMCWQQVIKKMPLTSAFANKAVTVVWGLIWGLIIFNETITIGKVIGGLLVLVGVIIFAYSDKKEVTNG